MLAIPTYLIAFFIAVMTVPEGTEQFTMDVKGKTVMWTREAPGWRAVELPRDDWGLHTIKGNQVTITGEGHVLKTNMSRFLSISDDMNWQTLAEVPVSIKQLGEPVSIQRENGKIVLSQKKGVLFEKAVTISWETTSRKSNPGSGDKNVKAPMTSSVDSWEGTFKISPAYIAIQAQDFPAVNMWLYKLEKGSKGTCIGFSRQNGDMLLTPKPNTQGVQPIYKSHFVLFDEGNVCRIIVTYDVQGNGRQRLVEDYTYDGKQITLASRSLFDGKQNLMWKKLDIRDKKPGAPAKD